MIEARLTTSRTKPSREPTTAEAKRTDDFANISATSESPSRKRSELKKNISSQIEHNTWTTLDNPDDELILINSPPQKLNKYYMNELPTYKILN